MQGPLKPVGHVRLQDALPLEQLTIQASEASARRRPSLFEGSPAYVGASPKAAQVSNRTSKYLIKNLQYRKPK